MFNLPLCGPFFVWLPLLCKAMDPGVGINFWAMTKFIFAF